MVTHHLIQNVKLNVMLLKVKVVANTFKIAANKINVLKKHQVMDHSNLHHIIVMPESQLMDVPNQSNDVIYI